MTDLERAYFPSWRLGYRCNPFRTLTRDEWRELAVLPEGLHTWIDSLPPLTQILGDQGRGKTSALLALEREINQRGWPVAYEYLPPGTKRYTQDSSDLQVFLLDEAQRLSRRSLKKLIKMVKTNMRYLFITEIPLSLGLIDIKLDQQAIRLSFGGGRLLAPVMNTACIALVRGNNA